MTDKEYDDTSPIYGLSQTYCDFMGMPFYDDKEYPDQKDGESLIDYHIRGMKEVTRWDDKEIDNLKGEKELSRVIDKIYEKEEDKKSFLRRIFGF